MLPKLSSFHYAALSIAGSLCSWRRAFRWAVDYSGIKAIWLLFRCRNGLELGMNLAAFLIYSKSASFSHCEALLIISWLFNCAMLLTNQPFTLNNSCFIVAWHLFASVSLPISYLKPIGKNYAVSERMISLLIATYFLSTDEICLKMVPFSIVVAAVACYLSRYLRSSETRFRCIKKVERYIDPQLLAKRTN